MESQNIREKKEVAIEVKVHLIVFKLGNEEYGVRIDQVKEVTITPEITRMPKTPSFIKGVSNIRGDIIAIMDLEERFRIAPADGPRKAHTYTLVMEAKDYTMGFIVREVPQSLSLPVSSIDKAPSFIQEININENFIEGIGKYEDRLIIVLDFYKILTSDEVMEIKS